MLVLLLCERDQRTFFDYERLYRGKKLSAKKSCKILLNARNFFLIIGALPLKIFCQGGNTPWIRACFTVEKLSKVVMFVVVVTVEGGYSRSSGGGW